MTYVRTIALLLLAGTGLLGQFPNGISQSVSRAVTVPPDEAVFTVYVNTTLDLESLLGILKKIEITAKDLVDQSVGLSCSGSGSERMLENYYNFGFTVAPGRMQEIAKNLNVLRQDLPEGIKDFQFSAYLSASNKAVTEARSRALPDLIADAQQRVDVLARLAGISLGAIESISDTFYSNSSGFGPSGSQTFVYSFSVFITFGRK